jgi:hypothetical protein
VTDRELMQQALEAMEYADACLKKQLTTKTKHEYAQDLLLEAGTALRERLTQPEQEPVDSAEKAEAYLDARLWEFIDMAAAWPEAKPDPRIWGHVMVYAPKQPSKPWVGLTDEERHSIREWQEIQKELGPVWAPMMLYLYLAIEQALKEKNT